MSLGQTGPVEQLGQNLPDALCLVHRHENEPGLGPLRAARKLYGMTELARHVREETTEKIRQPLTVSGRSARASSMSLGTGSSSSLAASTTDPV